MLGPACARPRCREGEGHGLGALLAKSPLTAPSWVLAPRSRSRTDVSPLPGRCRPSRKPLSGSSDLRRHLHFLRCLCSLLAEGYLSFPEEV